jgi:hypothetical protein
MPEARKKPCRICRRWFRPDSRVGTRQRACGKADCQKARRQKTQARWRGRNPSYAAAYRIDHRHQSEAAAPEPLRVPPPLNQLPWDLAKDQFGGKGADFIGVMGTLLLRSAKDQFKAQPVDSKGLSGTLPPAPEKTSSEPAHTDPRVVAAPDAATGISSTGPLPGGPPGSPPSATAPVAGLTG